MDEGQVLLSLSRMLKSLCWRFARRNRLDQQEMFGEVQLVALRAVRIYQPGALSLSSFVHRQVSWYLQEHVRRRCWRERMGGKEIPNQPLQIQQGHLDIDQWCQDKELSSAAVTAARIALAEEGEGGRRQVLKLLREELGWTVQIIQEVCAEIRAALH